MSDPTPTPARRSRQPLPPGLLRRGQSARFCAVGLSTWDRLTAAGKTPAPVRLGGSLCWSRAELAAWCRHGCPPRDEWQPIWQALLTARRAGRGR